MLMGMCCLHNTALLAKRQKGVMYDLRGMMHDWKERKRQWTCAQSSNNGQVAVPLCT